MKIYGLIGYPLTHSFSLVYFAEKFKKENIVNTEYRNFPLSNISQFKELIEIIPNLKGLNVTLPYKELVIQFIDDLDLVAHEIGAVNTIKFVNEGNKNILIGFNTDAYGFQKSLLPLIKPHHLKALVLGSGGASKAVVYVLQSLGMKVKIVSRNKEGSNFINYNQLTEELMNEYLVVVNTSPIGMYPNINDTPAIPFEFIGKSHILYDLVYNPTETEFLKKGMAKGATVKNGLDMLYFQAEKAWEIWNS